ncbi:MAG TPA: GNAT family N-acetyltransferase [Kineosporiaceae bacterium]|nr:GNAT family N-acetyltransferase [Kineosporiaceae bacterium]
MRMTVTVPAGLSTGELTLRPWTEDDVEPLIEAYRDPLLRRWTRVPVTTTDEARHWLDLQRRGLDSAERISFAVDESRPDPDGLRLVANVVLKLDARDRSRAEVGFWTAAPGRGRGIAPRAVTALTTWAYDTFAGAGLDRLELLHDELNQASCRVAEKAGYEFDRVLPAPAPSTAKGHLHVHRLR